MPGDTPDSPDELMRDWEDQENPTTAETRARIEREAKIGRLKPGYARLITSQEINRRNFVAYLVTRLAVGGGMTEASLVAYAIGIANEMEVAEADPWGLQKELFRQSLEDEGITLEDLE